jgi:hypothetical protein
MAGTKPGHDGNILSSFRPAPIGPRKRGPDGANPESITTSRGYGFRVCAQEGRIPE